MPNDIGPDGTQLWVNRYTTAGNAVADDLAVDSAGNVYVTGYSESGGNADYATIKYSPDGAELWVRRYDGPAGNDVALAMALDSAGNAYVTGRSMAATGSDCATIKYSPDGAELWVRRYSGPGGNAGATALAVDSSGNVYVAGNSVAATSTGYAMVKYGPDGAELWVRHYDGPAGNDYATALAVDSSGNAYVTGRSYGNGTGYDYATVKYSQDQGAINTPPVANAGASQTITTEDYCHVVSTIQGTAFDPDNDPLQYRWLEGQTVLQDWSAVGTNGEAYLDLCNVPLVIGQHTMKLEVSDGKATASDDMILTINNSAPNASPTGGGVYQIGTHITVGGQISDFDNDPLNYAWHEGNLPSYCTGSVQAPTNSPPGTPITLPDCTLPSLTLGDHILTLTVSDGINPPVSSNITVTIIDFDRADPGTRS